MCNAGLSPMSRRLKIFSRVRRVVPLKTASVLALLSCAVLRRIAGGTAEGMPFVPICGMMGFLFSH